MKIIFDRNITQNLVRAIQKEWLETNGLGGWASSTIIGANTRRYHGLLVAATQPPVGRMVLVSKMDETILLNGQRFELGCNLYPGAVHPAGYRYLHSFEKDLFPVFIYEAGGIVLQKTIAAIHGENTTLVLYEALNAPATFTLQLQPFIADRDFHSLTHANDAIHTEGTFENDMFQVRPYAGTPEIFFSVPTARFQPQPDWYQHFEYPVERYRGLDFQEDLFTYGLFQIELSAGDQYVVIISTNNSAGRDGFDLFQQEGRRRRTLLAPFPDSDELGKTLALAGSPIGAGMP